MIKGIPYWGDSTYNDMRAIEKIDNIEIEEKSIEEFGVDSMYELFYELAKRNTLIRVKEDEKYFYTYIRDINFNYRDRVIVLAYWSYSETIKRVSSDYEQYHLDFLEDGSVNIRYNYNLMYNIIDNRQINNRNKYIEVYDTTTKTLFKVKIEGLPYIKETDFSLEVLYDRYINAAYYLTDKEDYSFENRYHKIDKENGNNQEYMIRTEYNLNHYTEGKGNYGIINYKDFRHYKYQELVELLPQNLEDRKGYWERRYLFEAYLYCIFAEGLSVKEVEYHKEFNNLGVTKRFIKYDKGYISLILKYYYKDIITLRKKSYESYIKIE